jgi:hypothetical protein
MAVSLVASAFGYANGGNAGGNISNTTFPTSTKAFTYTPATTGNAIVFWVAMVPSGTAPTTCSLTATGWVFTQVGGLVNGGLGGVGAIFRAYAPNTSQATITMTWNQPSSTWFSDLTGEFSGADATNFVSASNTATGSGTPTVNVTPLDTNCIVWVACNDSVTAVGSIGGSTATQGANDTQQDWSEYRLLSGGAGVAQSCTITGSGTYIIGAVAIKPNDPPVIGSVPSGTAMTAGSLSAPFLFFDTGDYSPGL